MSFRLLFRPFTSPSNKQQHTYLCFPLFAGHFPFNSIMCITTNWKEFGRVRKVEIPALRLERNRHLLNNCCEDDVRYLAAH